MTRPTNKLNTFWNELKRRKVIRRNMVYVATSFVLLEFADIIVEPLGLPPKIVNYILILLCIGFIFSIILSWFYDITPDGFKKLKPAHKANKVSAEKISRLTAWKIATYSSIIIIIGLLLLDILDGKKSDFKLEQEKTIAVLPFLNYSGDSEQDYMCMGLTDEIINHLYKIESFDKVVPLNSVLSYQGTNKKMSFVADELGVNYLLGGTYKKVGNNLRVTAQLIEPKKNRQIWQNDYDRQYEEIISIQADIALKIADQLKVYLTSSEKQNIKKIPTTNQQAYEIIQQALHFDSLWNNTRDYQIELGLQAIQLDPGYADAYAWIGNWTIDMGSYFGNKEMSTVAWDALAFLEKALELDKNNFRAHYGMGLLYEWVRWDYIRAEEEYIKLTDLKPNYSPGYGLIVEFFLKMNRPEKALLYIEKIPEREMSFALDQLLRIHVLTGNQDGAYATINEHINLFGEDWSYRIGEYYLLLEEYDSAKIFLESAMQSERQEMLLPRFQACLALAYHKTKNYQGAQSIIDQQIKLSRETSSGSPAYFCGWYYSAIGDINSAFYWLEKAYRNRSPEMPWLKVDPVFKNLKEDDRYWDLYKRTGHKAYDEYLANMNN
jgi:TolB-like protein/Tfp pilus assembly protein PilF